ncbi:alpha-N-acetylglucosaminidase TIM-barrel domain-containing protein [Actinomycetes bacterium KLBMP 9797]
MEPPWAPAVHGLWARVAGAGRVESGHVESGRVALAPLAGRRAFEVSARDGVLHVAATDGVSASVGIHRYLRDACGIRITWDTSLPLALDRLPARGPLRGQARVDEFYYLNFCTYSYTTAYWGWDEWEREIDWMALHGVTMPLSLVGHEATLARAYGRMGLSEREIRTFLGGPGYLPFVYMGCLDSFAGPLPSGWLPARLALGRRILERQRAFGMTPVLPAFTGHVPHTLGTRRRTWQGLETTVVAAEDPLFRRLTTEIAVAQRELFGTDHRYASDPFIEMIPDEAARLPDAIVDGLRAADEDAVWVLQSWPFSYQRDYWTTERVREFLDRIPADRVLILDLWGEAEPQWPRLDGYAGRPWIWNGLLNFGGRTEPVADLASTDRNLEAALASDRPPVGLGLTMEAIHNNPAFYALIADRAWSYAPLDGWLRSFGAERYGAAVDAAWDALRVSVYAADSRAIFPERFISIAVSTPDYSFVPAPTVRYEPRDLVAACEALLDATVPQRTALANDLALCGIALLLRVIDGRYNALIRVRRVDPGAAARFLAAFDDLDALAATRPDLCLETWVAAATRWASDADGQRVLADNARRIVTVWNTPENPHLDNYAARLWGGLVAGYLKRRWELWLRHLPAALAPDGRDAAQAALDDALRTLATEFVARKGPLLTHSDGKGPFLTTPPGDTHAVAARVLDRYRAEFLALKGTADRAVH